MSMKHFISIHDITGDEFSSLLDLALKLKKETKEGIPHPILKGKTLGMIFTKSSTRTRVSFEVGMYQLGGHPLFLNANDMQLGRGESIYETALRHRVFFTRGDNRRIPGWMQLHYRMSFDGEGYPMLYVFENCRAFIRTVPGLSYSTTAPEDVDTGQEDHAADESRYFCMMRPIAPRERTEIRRKP